MFNGLNIYDTDVYSKIDIKDLWVYDKLILAKLMGYIAGPAGVDLPSPGEYIVIPITNLMGMGKGAYIHNFNTVDTSSMSPGFFWSEIFSGPHLSIDVVNGKTDVVYEGTPAGLHRFTSWRLLYTDIKHPDFIIDLSRKYGVVNYETRGDKILEVHLRANPDWTKHRADVLIPVWADDVDLQYLIADKDFVYDPDNERLGFIVKRSSSKF